MGSQKVVSLSQPWEPSSQGCSVGMCEGAEVGVEEGMADGRRLGSAVGAREGRLVGWREGLLVGMAEGALEGLRVGRPVASQRLRLARLRRKPSRQTHTNWPG